MEMLNINNSRNNAKTKGCARIALQAAAHGAVCGTFHTVRIVPTHICFEAHDVEGSSVLIELGEHIDIRCSEVARRSTDDTDADLDKARPCHGRVAYASETAAGRAQVQRITQELSDRMALLTDRRGPDITDAPGAKRAGAGAGSKRSRGGRRGGHTMGIKVANEWKVIRCIDAMLCLYDTACAPAWVDRVQITRLIAQIARADKGAEACVVRAHAAIGAFEGALADIDASASLYLTPASIMWDLDIRTKLVPRAVRSGCDGGLQGGIGPLLNFHHCASTWEATAERMGAITAYTRMEDTVRAEMRLLVANHGFIRERVDAL